MNASRILMVADPSVLDSRLRQCLDQVPDLLVCAEASDGPHALSLLETSQPDIVLVGISLRTYNGLELIKGIRGSGWAGPILMVSIHHEDVYAERALRAGANGYVGKQASCSDIIEAVRRVLQGEFNFSESITTSLLSRIGHEDVSESDDGIRLLTDRELEVFEGIGRREPVVDIAERLNLSPKTVESHRHRIKDKLGIRTTSELTDRAVHWLTQDGGQSSRG